MNQIKFSKGMLHDDVGCYDTDLHAKMHRDILAKPLGYVDPTPDYKRDRRWVSPTSLHYATHQSLLPQAAPLDSIRMMTELKTVFMASQKRQDDIPDSEMPMVLNTDIDFGGWQLSKDRFEIPEKIEYMTNFQSWKDTQDGYPDQDKQKIVRGPIKKYKDLAYYVSKDKMEHWFAFHALMKQEKVPLNPSCYQYNVNQNEFDFILWGSGNACKMMMEVVMLAMYEGGAAKYGEMRARPEELAGALALRPKQFKKAGIFMDWFEKNKGSLGMDVPFLPMMVASGSPYHPSWYAWHYFGNAAAAAFWLAWFDQYYVLSNGNTVRQEILKLKNAISMARSYFGVHYPSDNLPLDSKAYQETISGNLSMSVEDNVTATMAFPDESDSLHREIHRNPEVIFDEIVRGVLTDHRDSLKFQTCPHKWQGLSGRMAA